MISAAPSGRSFRGSSNIVLLLSLKLILLAFFIMLNSLSEFEAGRARAVIDSVNRAFNGKLTSAERAPAHSPSLGALPEFEAKINELGSLFEAIIPAATAKWIRRAQAVRVDLPARAIFGPAGVALRPGREDLIQRLGRTLARDPRAGLSYSLEVLLGFGTSGGTPAAMATRNPRSIEVRRAAVLAQRLIEAGVPARALSIGLLPQHPGTLRFVVRVQPDPVGSAPTVSGVESGS
jgi:hypothetical protein